MFLTAEEVSELTGYVRHAEQRKWLERYGWTFAVAATGRPIVSKAHFESRMGMAESAIAWSPNLAAIR